MCINGQIIYLKRSGKFDKVSCDNDILRMKPGSPLALKIPAKYFTTGTRRTNECDGGLGS
jgi:hypothetical protein